MVGPQGHGDNAPDNYRLGAAPGVIDLAHLQSPPDLCYQMVDRADAVRVNDFDTAGIGV